MRWGHGRQVASLERITGGRSTTLDDRNLRGSVKGIMDLGSDSKISQDNNIYTGNLLAIFLFLFVFAIFLNLNTTGLVKSHR